MAGIIPGVTTINLRHDNVIARLLLASRSRTMPRQIARMRPALAKAPGESQISEECFLSIAYAIEFRPETQRKLDRFHLRILRLTLPPRVRCITHITCENIVVRRREPGNDAGTESHWLRRLVLMRISPSFVVAFNLILLCSKTSQLSPLAPHPEGVDCHAAQRSTARLRCLLGRAVFPCR